MFSSETSAWITRVVTALTALACVQTIRRILRGELPDYLLGGNYLLAFFLIGIALSVLALLLSFESFGSNSLLQMISVYLVNSLHILLPIPISLSVIYFYCKKLEILPWIIEHHFYFEADILVFSIVWYCLLKGMHSRVERALFSSILPLGMLGACAAYRNIFGPITVLIYLCTTFSSLAYESFQANPLPSKEILFREVTLVLAMATFMCATVWKIIEWNSGQVLFLQNSLWMALDDYAAGKGVK